VLLLALTSTLLLGAEPNVVLITADTLRADHLKSYGYFRQTSPVLDALAAEGLVFETVYVTMSSTLASHTSIMTSSYPVRHGILSNLRFYRQPVATNSGFRTAAQLFSQAGYRTAGFTSASPLSEASGIQAGFQTFQGPPPFETQSRRVAIPAKKTTDRALAWLQSVEPPFFLWVHYFDPHHPYRPPPEYQGLFKNGEPLGFYLKRIGIPSHELRSIAHITNRYDGEIRYMDEQIGRIFQTLRERGLYDEALVIFTGDHGEGLGQHGELRHGLVWDEQTRAPLIFKWPASSDAPRGRRRDLASSIDILPTAVETVGLELPLEQWDGVNLLRAEREFTLSQRDGRKIARWPGYLYALSNREWKLLYATEAPARLYHLATDPYERKNIIEEHREVAVRMQQELLRLLSENQARSPLQVQPELPDTIKEQLRELGYVE
jgi:arylsulfatase A-like enzyme